MAATLTQGSFRYIGGKLSRQGNATLKTPVATLGIRGSDITVDYDAGKRLMNVVTTHGLASLTAGNDVINLRRRLRRHRFGIRYQAVSADGADRGADRGGEPPVRGLVRTGAPAPASRRPMAMWPNPGSASRSKRKAPPPNQAPAALREILHCSFRLRPGTMTRRRHLRRRLLLRPPRHRRPPQHRRRHGTAAAAVRNAFGRTEPHLERLRGRSRVPTFLSNETSVVMNTGPSDMTVRTAPDASDPGASRPHSSIDRRRPARTPRSPPGLSGSSLGMRPVAALRLCRVS